MTRQPVREVSRLRTKDILLVNPMASAKAWVEGISKTTTIKETKQRVRTTFMQVMEEGGKSLEMLTMVIGRKIEKGISRELGSELFELQTMREAKQN